MAPKSFYNSSPKNCNGKGIKKKEPYIIEVRLDYLRGKE